MAKLFWWLVFLGWGSYWLVAMAASTSVPPYLKELAKAVHCDSLVSCNQAAEKIIKKEGLAKWISLLKKQVNQKKYPKEYKSLISQFEKLIPSNAATGTKSTAKSVPPTNPCPVINKVQWRPVPKEPATKFCFGIKDKIYYIAYPHKSPQPFPQYVFKKSLKCSAAEVIAIKPDGSGIECAKPGPDVLSFTYDYCPSGFATIPRPEEGDLPKYCFGFLSSVNAYAIWPLLAPSSSYAVIPEEQFGVNKQCNYPSGEARTLVYDTNKKDFTIDCRFKSEALYPLPDRLSYYYPLLSFNYATDTLPDQASAANACFNGKYVDPFAALKASICRSFGTVAHTNTSWPH